MFRNKTKWLGVGAVALGLSLPFAARAHGDDEAVAFIAGAAVGAAVGYAIGDDRGKHRHVHYRGDPRTWHGYGNRHDHYRHYGYAHKHWARSHRDWHRDARDYRRDRYARHGHYREHHDRDRYGGRYSDDRHRDGYRKHDRDGRGSYRG